MVERRLPVDVGQFRQSREDDRRCTGVDERLAQTRGESAGLSSLQQPDGRAVRGRGVADLR